jgi:hypothetical protein
VRFATSPIVGLFSQRVQSEMPALALMLVTLTFLERFRRQVRLRDYLLFIASAVATMLCRPTAVYMFPAYGAFLLLDRGWNNVMRGGAAVATLAGVWLVGAAVVAFLLLSPFNSSVVLHVLRQGVEPRAFWEIWLQFQREQPLMLAAAAGVAASLLARDRRIGIALFWALSVLASALLLTGAIEVGRYTILAVPAYCIAAASLCAWPRARHQAVLCAALLMVAAGLQLRNGLDRPTWDAPGYEQAAQYVLARAPGPTVLYSASVDPGYFVFFVRKHDPAQRLVVLRSDKLLTTSLMARLSVEDLIAKPEDIYAILRRYGTRYVVIEDRPSGSAPLDWLRDAVRGERFVERQRFVVENGFPSLRGVALIVYEYREATAAAPDAELDLSLPLVGRRIRVPLSELAVTPGH